MTNGTAVAMSNDERLVVVQGLKLLAASFRRSANKAGQSDDVRKIYERDSDRVDALAAKFR